MGLDNGDRVNQMFKAVIALNDLRGFTNSSHQEFNTLLGQVIPAFLSSKEVTCRDLDSNYLCAASLVKSAFKNVIKYFDKDYQYDFKTSQDPYERHSEFFECYMPTMPRLLVRDYCEGTAYNQQEYSKVSLVFQAASDYMYSAGYYDDEFFESFSKTNDLVRKVQGLCLKLFGENEVYFAAYMASHIFRNILSEYKIDDLASKWFMEHCLHHYVSCKNVPKPLLLKYFKQCRSATNSKPIRTQRKIQMILKFLGSSYHYRHNHKDLLTRLERHNAANKQDQVNIRFVKKILDKKIDQNLEKEKNRTYPKYDYLFCEEIGKL